MKRVLVKTTLVFVAVFLLLKVVAQTSEADRIIGVWLSENGKAKIKIYKQGNKYYGKIIWLKEPYDENGKPKVDKNNPDPEKRNRPIQGLVILKDFVYDSEDKEWEDGTIYDPESGNTYDAYMWFEDNNYNTLYLRGYIGFSLIGRTSKWTRVE